MCVQILVKVLHVNKGESGNYKLTRSNKPFPLHEQARFVQQWPEIFKQSGIEYRERTADKHEDDVYMIKKYHRRILNKTVKMDDINVIKNEKTD